MKKIQIKIKVYKLDGKSIQLKEEVTMKFLMKKDLLSDILTLNDLRILFSSFKCIKHNPVILKIFNKKVTVCLEE